VSDKQQPSAPRRFGRGLARALSGLFGKKTLKKAAESARVLKQQYREGKREAAGPERPPPRRIGHEEVGDDDLND